MIGVSLMNGKIGPMRLGLMRGHEHLGRPITRHVRDCRQQQRDVDPSMNVSAQGIP